MSRQALEKIPLICAPTPLHRLNFLSDQLGIDLWIKRDDLTGFAAGGNKGRKIEYLIPDVLRQRTDVVVVQGAAQSNFIRQMGAACLMHGIRCVACVMELPYYAEAGSPQGAHPSKGGNVFLNEIFGVEMRWFENGDWDQLDAHADATVEQLQREGLKVHKINVGGSSLQGAMGFYEAGEELAKQHEDFDFIVTASSSGSTHSGLHRYFAERKTRVIGISADPDPAGELLADVRDLVQQLTDHLELPETDLGLVDLRMDYCGEAYGIPSEEGMEAMRRFAQSEGVLLDPVYTSKAAHGLLELIRAGEVYGSVVFWHTGGTPGLFATS
jgi:1-aminocyclopropane-1-carboxylate deaminase/D-cysteine desulfhydrase-like pyridoxal-dependent ACC family enzyme